MLQRRPLSTPSFAPAPTTGCTAPDFSGMVTTLKSTSEPSPMNPTLELQSVGLVDVAAHSCGFERIQQ
jgi:hypothetical protein